MKTNLRLLTLALCAASSLSAAPLTSATAVHTRPEAGAPAVAVLKAGSEPASATGDTTPLPPGWQAVELTGPHEVYVHGKDLTKNLDLKPGASFRTQPKAEAAVLTTYTAGDSAEITGLHGKWTQFRLKKTVIGYIQLPLPGSAPITAQPVASTAALPAYTPPPPAPATTAPAGSVSTSSVPSLVQTPDAGSAALPRLFKGRVVSSGRSLIGRRPYDFQLNDDGGERYAYLDISRLLLTEQIEKYIDRTVVVYGTARPVPNTKDIVIVVESLQLQ